MPYDNRSFEIINLVVVFYTFILIFYAFYKKMFDIYDFRDSIETELRFGAFASSYTWWCILCTSL